MEFRLVYRGPLHTSTDDKRVPEKQAIRRALHPQLAALWKRPGLSDKLPELLDKGAVPTSEIEGFRFVPTVWQVLCELDLLFLRRGEPGTLVAHGGDIDNRLKTLLDALRVPRKKGEVPANDGPREGENPFYCLLEDDSVITHLGVTTDTLLDLSMHPDNVVLIIHVSTKARLGRILAW